MSQDRAKSGRPLILCVDDSEAQLQMRRQILEHEGYAVITATNAPAALEILREAPVSLVLSDHMLSGTIGTQLAAEIKNIKRDVPVVLHSGSVPQSMRHIDCFISKGEPIASFLAIIRDLIKRFCS